MAVDTQRGPARRVRRKLIPLALAAVPLLAATAVAAGQHGSATAPAGGGPSGVEITPLAQATIDRRVHVNSAGIKIRTRGPRDMLATSITVAPGGTFGWHTHPGPVLVAVASGTLSLYEPHHGGCPKRTVGPSHGFIEGGGDVHLARNE